MNAREARQKSLSITGTAEKRQYAEIKNKISTSVDSGKLSCHYYKTIMLAVQLKLEAEGYNVASHFDQRDGTTITISW